jgi:predicted nuclease of predicted toxin-antitoxin system
VVPTFKVDENLPAEVLDLLRGARHDAASVTEQGLGGAPDDVVARVCRDERRTLVTLDRGFGDIRKYPPPLHPGIVVLRLARRDRRSLVGALRRALDQCSGEPLEARLCVITEAAIRRRSR